MKNIGASFLVWYLMGNEANGFIDILFQLLDICLDQFMNFIQ